MFDLKTLAVIKQINVGPGLDGIMYDEPDDKIILTNHSRPISTVTAIDPKSGDIVATVELEDAAPEGAARGKLGDRESLGRQSTADLVAIGFALCRAPEIEQARPDGICTPL